MGEHWRNPGNKQSSISDAAASFVFGFVFVVAVWLLFN